MNTTRTSATRRRLSSLAFAAVLWTVAIVFQRPLVAWFAGTSTTVGPADGSPNAATRVSTDIDHYTCSMHPSVNQKGPGKCPICGMDLIPVTKSQEEKGVVLIDESRRQLIGVRTGPVVEAPMRRTFRAVGRIAYDESKLTDVNLRVQGWITKLFVTETGQRVRTGQPLFLVYSPELYDAQQDFLLATRGGADSGGGPGGAEFLVRAARQRLHLLGLGDPEIDVIAKRDAPVENVTIPAPASGFVIEKNVVEGASVDLGVRLFRIAGLSDVWVEADVYEGDLAHVHVGQSATVTLDYLPGQSYGAKVAYVYPYLDATTRTGHVRMELANKNLDLRPGMYATVELASEAEPRVQVPASAVVYTGPRRLVFVDLGQGRFQPQEIHVGTEADGMYEVLAGLRPGRDRRYLRHFPHRRRSADQHGGEVLGRHGLPDGIEVTAPASKGDREPSLIARLIAASAHRPFLTILFVGALAAWGWVSLRRAPLDAIPDLSDVQVIVFTDWTGQSPDLVEDQVTYPISAALISAPRVKAVRGESMFGMSFVNVIFDEGTDIYWARSRVLEYLNSVRARLPQGVNPTLGPDATGVGWVFEYALVDESGKHDLQELRSIQDWTSATRSESVPGVAEVASVGGYVKQYQVNVDPNKLLGSRRHDGRGRPSRPCLERGGRRAASSRSRATSR